LLGSQGSNELQAEIQEGAAAEDICCGEAPERG
jgi:hypothetical protein